MRTHEPITMEFLKGRPLSSSSLKQFMRSPKHYIEYIFGPKKSTEAYLQGGAFDTMLLQPDAFDEKYCVAPECDKRTKVGKETWEKFIADNPTKQILTQDQYDICVRMKEEVYNNKAAAEIMGCLTNTQRKLEWTDKATGLPLIGFVDGEGTKQIKDTSVDIMLELKSAIDASEDGFARAAFNFGYQFQAATYLKGYAKQCFKFPELFFIAVEKAEPFAVNVFKPTDAFIKLGEEQFEMALQKFKYCMENNLWHQGYEFHTAVGYAQLELPGYAKRLLQDE